MKDFKDQMLELANKEGIDKVEEYLGDIGYGESLKKEILDFINYL